VLLLVISVATVAAIAMAVGLESPVTLLGR
jgi:hypothetical protein